MSTTVQRFLPGWVGLKKTRRKDVSRGNFGMDATPNRLNQRKHTFPELIKNKIITFT